MSTNREKRPKWDFVKDVAGVLVVIGALFLAFAPESVWQSGSVTPAGERKAGGSFTMTNLDGNLWKLDQQRGKVVLVNYWATWCPPCRVETPGLVRLANEYQSRGVEIVGVSLDEDAGAIRPFIDDYKIPYPILLPADKSNLSLMIEALPTTLLYDRQGRLAKRYTGAVSESIFRADVESLLKEQ
ncbi:MAG: TlpA family protein disulfide reductase [Blastocatellia bacterium]|nr:TlpA family protein disulfide reductase [Blastocatellia bacterium]